MTALTTLSQKLLRIPLDVFQQKDIPDIDKMLRKLKVVMLPRYFHYIDPADPLNHVLDRSCRVNGLGKRIARS